MPRRCAASFAVAPRGPGQRRRGSNEAEAALRVELGRRGYAFAEVGDAEVVVDHETRTATLVLPVDAGRRAAVRPGSLSKAGPCSAPAIWRPSPASARASRSAPSGSRICARLWSRPASSPASPSARSRGRGATSSISPSDRAGADAHHRRRGGLRHRRGRSGSSSAGSIATCSRPRARSPSAASPARASSRSRPILRRNNFMRRDQVLNAPGRRHPCRPAGL